MPFADTIVGYINHSLKGCSLFTDGTFHGIATIIARKKTAASPIETLPGILLENKAYQTVEPNDKHGLIIYHKAISNQYSFDKQGSFGDGYRSKCLTEMNMIVFADGKKLMRSAEEIEPLVVFRMPQTLPAEIKAKLSIISCLITPTGSVMDRLLIWRQEYPQTDFSLKPHHHLFSVRYRIEAAYDQRCVDKCLCGE